MLSNELADLLREISNAIQDFVNCSGTQEAEENTTEEKETICIRTRTTCPFCGVDNDISTTTKSTLKVKAHRVHHECNFCKSEWICKAGVQWYIPVVEEEDE